MDFTFFTPWHQVLPREAGHVVAFAGGRGKADLVAAVAEACTGAGLAPVHCGPGAPDPGDLAFVLADADGPAPGLLRPAGAPVAWPGRTSLAVLEAAAGAVGSRADQVLPAGGRPVGLEAWQLFEWDHLAEMVLARVREVPAAVPVLLALTGLEDQPDSVGLFGFVGRMMAEPRLAVVLFCSRSEAGLAVRACCRAGEP